MHRGPTPPTDGGRDVGPIDVDILDRIATRLSGDDRFSTVARQPEYAPDSVILEYDLAYFPSTVDRAYLRLRWYVTDDFTIHYSEQYENWEGWECCWDRHPNDHNTRAHFHPPPDAGTPGEDADYSCDWRDVLPTVITALDERIQAFWD